jgi:chromosome segregation ATPase
MPPSVDTVAPSPTHTHTPNMKRASTLPFPAYPTPPTPWQSAGSTSPSPPTNNGSQQPHQPTGKTSQVIEKLTADNDRLRRELKAERAAKDEALQQQRALRGLVDSLQDKRSTLEHQLGAHDGALARKERRIDDLKAGLEQESGRRRRAEEREAEMGRKLGETTAEAAKQVAEAKLAARASEAACATVSKEYLALRGRVDALQRGFETFAREAEAGRRERETRVAKLEVLLDQKRQAMEQAVGANREQAAVMRQYKAEIGETEERKREMIETTQRMKWLMQLHQARQHDS